MEDKHTWLSQLLHLPRSRSLHRKSQELDIVHNLCCLNRNDIKYKHQLTTTIRTALTQRIRHYKYYTHHTGKTKRTFKSSIVWDITLYSPLKVNWCITWTCHIHFHGLRIRHARNQGEGGSKQRTILCED
jgi:hypothetical protein